MLKIIRGAKWRSTLITAVLAATIWSAPSFAQEPMNRENVETIIRDYLLKNPELLTQMQAALEQKQQIEAEQKQKQFIAANEAMILNADYQIEFGDPNAPITIVEFFDYNCHFCQKAMKDMQDILKTNKNVKFVLREFPVLGEQSIDASKVSLAFSKLMPEKYAEYHIALLSKDGIKDGPRALEVAKSFGVDEAALKAETENPKIIEAISQAYQIADNLGISGTPSYIIGDQVIFGAVGFDALDQATKAANDG